jgi:hypothetical protein
MEHLIQTPKGRFETVTPLIPGVVTTAGGSVEIPALSIAVDYSLGGSNMFTGAATARGVYMYVSPCTITKWGLTMSLFGDLKTSGAKVAVLPLARKSAKRLAECAATLDPVVPELVEMWKAGEYKAVFTRIRSLFPAAVTPGAAPVKTAPAPAVPGMMLLTKELERQMPALRSQETVADPIVHVKFFTPDGAATWLATEYDPTDRMFFGYVSLGFGPGCDELGEFSLDELQAARGKMGLPVERDKFWTPVPLSMAKERCGMAA